jgi:hypothetical protein
MNAYCPPSIFYGCAYLDMIDNFILPGELCTQINDWSTGCAANGYDNRISESVTLFANKTYTVTVSTQYSTGEQFAIWIDFYNNFIFESSERVAYGPMNSTLNTPIAIIIPSIGSGATIGVHRMRALLAYGNTPIPCGTSSLYGEAHDYTVNIVASVCKLSRF